VLDTCHAGQLVADLMAKREVPSSYQRAMERMRDRTGLFVLAGSAADAVSYEASRYGQGLLTYALLYGMRGPALRDGALVDVAALYGYAVEAVPDLARGISGIQQPVLAAGGSTFTIGAITPETAARIPVAAPLSVVEPSSLQDNEEMDDVLGLGAKVDAVLRDLAAVQPAPFVFVAGTGMPDALRLAGRYSRLADGSIRVTARLFRDHARVSDRVMRGGEIDTLARRIAELVLDHARRPPRA
jgi:uncharacterized caspase-like protein